MNLCSFPAGKPGIIIKSLPINALYFGSAAASPEPLKKAASILQVGRHQCTTYEATLSMHSDYRKGTKTELESLAGYVVQVGKEQSVPTPAYEMM